MKVLKNEDISKLKKEMLRIHTIVYELSLKNDIDTEKSPRNNLKHTDDYCEFVFEEGIEIPFNDMEVIFGQLKEKEDHFEGKLQEQSFHKNEDKFEKIFSAILPLNDEYDIVNVNLKGQKGQQFQMSVYDNYMHQIKKDIKTGIFENGEDTELYQERNMSLEGERACFKLESPNVVSIFMRDIFADYMIFQYACLETISFYLDYKLKKISINNQKWRDVYDFEFDKLSHFEICGILENNTISFENDTFDIYKIGYAKNEGYIYLNPIELQKGNYKLFVYYSGKVEVEYFKWNESFKVLPEKFRFTEKEVLNLRVKMNSGNKLYGLFIVK